MKTYLFSPDSDVFVYQNSKDELICQYCSLVLESFYKAADADDMITHLEFHMDDDDKVPNQLIEDLKNEQKRKS
jgi:hypothetical protein